MAPEIVHVAASVLITNTVCAARLLLLLLLLTGCFQTN
jgi:hypothetical protein